MLTKMQPVQLIQPLAQSRHFHCLRIDLNTAPGRAIALGIWRDGARKSIDVKVGDVTDSGDNDS